jgi:hypothetical protein
MLTTKRVILGFQLAFECYCPPRIGIIDTAFITLRYNTPQPGHIVYAGVCYLRSVINDKAMQTTVTTTIIIPKESLKEKRHDYTGFSQTLQKKN